MLLAQSAGHTLLFRYSRGLNAALAMRRAYGLPDPASCLSFGCSTGEECLSIRASLPHAAIAGCDRNPEAVRDATDLATPFGADIFMSDWDEIERRGPFDLILANAVFCHHPGSLKRDTIADALPFDFVSDAVGRLTELLSPGGLLMLMDCAYPVAFLPAARDLIPISTNIDVFFGNGKTERFLPDGRKFAKRWMAANNEHYELVRDHGLGTDEALFDHLYLKAGHPLIHASRLQITREAVPELLSAPLIGQAETSAWRFLPATGTLAAQSIARSLYDLTDGDRGFVEIRTVTDTGTGSVLQRTCDAVLLQTGLPSASPLPVAPARAAVLHVDRFSSV